MSPISSKTIDNAKARAAAMIRAGEFRLPDGRRVPIAATKNPNPPVMRRKVA